ncbi:MAG: biotin--[acetyl-CoA-carboxylase] ligase [Acidobacteria bacterium]|nr:biotin--[acetyl-CoA-carboxylase] ligase [Acidobacteriota bacterium]
MTLDIAQVRARLPGREIVWLEVTGSTMTDAALLAAAGCASGTAVVAEEQTAGQGRHGRVWRSERASGLYLTVVLRLPLPLDDVPVLTLALGLATAEAIARTTGLACDLRWPNDVLLDGRKCAGILVQTAGGAFLVGIGINVNHAAFPAELAGSATSLRLVSGVGHSREALLEALLLSLDSFVKMLVEGGRDPVVRMFSRSSSYTFGKRVTVEQGGALIEGVTDGLTPSGFLMLRRDDGTTILITAGGVRPAGP